MATMHFYDQQTFFFISFNSLLIKKSANFNSTFGIAKPIIWWIVKISLPLSTAQITKADCSIDAAHDMGVLSADFCKIVHADREYHEYLCFTDLPELLFNPSCQPPTIARSSTRWPHAARIMSSEFGAFSTFLPTWIEAKNLASFPTHLRSISPGNRPSTARKWWTPVAFNRSQLTAARWLVWGK